MNTILAILSLLLTVSCSRPSRHPTDELLIQNFTTHRQEFEYLITMIHADRGLRRVDDNWTDPADPTTVGVPSDRIADYRRRFTLCGIPRGFYSFDSGSNVSFIATAFGFTTGGSGKGYAYFSAPPLTLNLVPSTDSYRTTRQGAYRVYRHIADNWYIEYDYDD